MNELFKLTETEYGNRVVPEVTFDPIPVGTAGSAEFWIQNKAPAVLTIEAVLSETDGPGEIEVLSFPDEIPEGEAGRVRLQASPIEAEELAGLTAEIELQANAIIKPN